MSVYKHMVVSEDSNSVGTQTTLATAVTGAGGTVTQATDKSTGVTLNTQIGQITMNNASLGADVIVSFTLTNSAIAATSNVTVLHYKGGTAGKYVITAFPAAGSAVISVTNISAGSLSEAIQLRFEVTPGSDS